MYKNYKNLIKKILRKLNEFLKFHRLPWDNNPKIKPLFKIAKTKDPKKCEP